MFSRKTCVGGGMACKDAAYEEISNGARKVHPFFHSEQPKAVLPLMMCPFPQSGQRSPSLGAGGVAGITAVWGAADFLDKSLSPGIVRRAWFCSRLLAILRAVLGALADFSFTFPFFPFGTGLSSCVSATRRLVLSARTVCTISATICLSSSKKVLAS